MNIDDFLSKKEFKKLNTPGQQQYLIDEMYRAAGSGLVDKILKTLETTKIMTGMNWFYSELRALGERRPYDFCKEGNRQIIEELLGRIEHGIYS